MGPEGRPAYGRLADGGLVDGGLADGALADGALADGALAVGTLADAGRAPERECGRFPAAPGSSPGTLWRSSGCRIVRL